jgi:hypothetical protein
MPRRRRSLRVRDSLNARGNRLRDFAAGCLAAGGGSHAISHIHIDMAHRAFAIP